MLETIQRHTMEDDSEEEASSLRLVSGPRGSSSTYLRVPSFEDSSSPLLSRRRAGTITALVVVCMGISCATAAAFASVTRRFTTAALHALPLTDTKHSQEGSAPPVLTQWGACDHEHGLDGLQGNGEKCFCLFTGQCKHDFECKDLSLVACQHKWCMDRSALEVTSTAASFQNVADAADVLTIPVGYYRDLGHLKACRPDAMTLLAIMLEAGRRVFIGSSAGGVGTRAEIQCAHLPGQVSVQWLHLHTFIGTVPGEGLPGGPPFAICASTKMGTGEAAQLMLHAT